MRALRLGERRAVDRVLMLAIARRLNALEEVPHRAPPWAMHTRWAAIAAQ